MDSNENLELRVTAGEAEVAVVRQEAAAARALAAGADRDVADYRAEMRAHTRGLAALRETQLEHYAEHKADLAVLRETLVEQKADLGVLREMQVAQYAEHKADLAAVRQMQIELRTEVTAGMAHIVRLVEGLDGGPRHRES